jgi:hypothetical protein
MLWILDDARGVSSAAKNPDWRGGVLERRYLPIARAHTAFRRGIEPYPKFSFGVIFGVAEVLNRQSQPSMYLITQ